MLETGGDFRTATSLKLFKYLCKFLEGKLGLLAVRKLPLVSCMDSCRLLAATQTQSLHRVAKGELAFIKTELLTMEDNLGTFEAGGGTATPPP